MKKNTFKLILDLIMSALLILMFKKNVLTLAFHEIGGIIVCLLFIFHFIINFNWVKAITKKIFAQNTPFKMRLSYIIDILLLIDTIAILFTGIGISKVFSPKIAFLPKSATPFHFFTGGLFVILICIHIGLHWNWIKNMFYKKKQKTFCKTSSHHTFCFSRNSYDFWCNKSFKIIIIPLAYDDFCSTKNRKSFINGKP